jgi:hypothetical protein
MMAFENVPRALCERSQWILWHWGRQDAKTSLPAKLPLVRESDTLLTGDDWNKYPERWVTFNQALVLLQRKRWMVRSRDKKHQRECPSEPPRYYQYPVDLAGIGIALRHDVNPANQILLAFDIDDHDEEHKRPLVRDGQIIDPMARYLVERIASYTEITPSGFGLRVLCLVPALPSGVLPTITDAVYHNLPFQIYVTKFITVTGQHVAGTPTDVQESALDKLVTDFTFAAQTAGVGSTPRRILASQRHDYLKKMATKAITACWITDRPRLISHLKFLRDVWCEKPQEKLDEEIERIADWALLRCTPNPLWQSNDSYLASTLIAADPKYAAAWRADLAPFSGDANGAFEYVTGKLLAACGNDAEQVTRIFAASPLRPTWEQQLPAHLRNVGDEQ